MNEDNNVVNPEVTEETVVAEETIVQDATDKFEEAGEAEPAPSEEVPE